jgi:hypothetical protein
MQPKAVYTIFSATQYLHQKENHYDVTKSSVYCFFNNPILTP